MLWLARVYGIAFLAVCPDLAILTSRSSPEMPEMAHLASVSFILPSYTQHFLLPFLPSPSCMLSHALHFLPLLSLVISITWEAKSKSTCLGRVSNSYIKPRLFHAREESSLSHLNKHPVCCFFTLMKRIYYSEFIKELLKDKMQTNKAVICWSWVSKEASTPRAWEV